MEGQLGPQSLDQMLLERFTVKNPLAASMRLVLERLFVPDELNALFENNRGQQYTRKILFVTILQVMLAVVTLRHPPVFSLGIPRVPGAPGRGLPWS